MGENITDLSNVTFIIPLRIDSYDRLSNIVLSTSFLLNKFDCRVLVKESDETRKFEVWALPLIQKLCSSLGNLTYIFERNLEDYFHRTRLLNDMILLSTTDIVVNYDSDIILPITSYIQAKNMLDSKKYDLVYPYKFGKRGEKKVVIAKKTRDKDDLNNLLEYPLIKEFVNNYNPDVFNGSFFYAPHNNGAGWAEYGMVQFFNREAYISGYMENEAFVAYAPEDVERHHRWKLLGYNIGRVDNFAFHLEHERTPNSSSDNPYMQHNNQLWEGLRQLSRKELIEYYENQAYVKRRLKERVPY